MNNAYHRLHQQAGELPRAYWALFVARLLDWVGKFVVVFLSLYLAEDLKLSTGDVTLVVTVLGAASAPAPIIGGIIADRVGRRAIVYLGFWVTALLLLALSFATSVTALLIIAALLGFLGSLSFPAFAALIADVVPAEQRKTAYNLNYWAVNVGATIALPLAGFLASVDYKLLFYGDALTAFVAGLIVWRFAKVKTDPVTIKPRPNLLAPMRDRLMLGIVVLTFLFATIFFQTQLALPLDMNANGISEVEFGAIMGINPLIIVLFQLPLSAFIKRWQNPPVLAVSGLLLGIGFGLTAFASTPFAYLLTIAIWTLGEMLFFPMATTLVAEISPDDQRAGYQGLFLTAWRPTSFIGVGLGGIILDLYGSATLWGLCFVIGVVISLGYLLIGQAMVKRTAPVLAVSEVG